MRITGPFTEPALCFASNDEAADVVQFEGFSNGTGHIAARVSVEEVIRLRNRRGNAVLFWPKDHGALQ